MNETSINLTNAKKEAETYMKDRLKNESIKERTTREVIAFIDEYYEYLYYDIIQKVYLESTFDKNEEIYSRFNSFFTDKFGSYDQEVIDIKLKEFNILNESFEFKICTRYIILNLLITSFIPILINVYFASVIGIIGCIAVWFISVFLISIIIAGNSITASHPEKLK